MSLIILSTTPFFAQGMNCLHAIQDPHVIYSRFEFIDNPYEKRVFAPKELVAKIQKNVDFYFPDPKDAAAVKDFFDNKGVLTVSDGAYFFFDSENKEPTIALSPNQLSDLAEGKFSFSLLDALDTFRHELRHYQDWKEKTAELKAKGVEKAEEEAQNFFASARGRELTEKNAVGAGLRALKNFVVRKPDFRAWIEKESKGAVTYPDEQGINHFAQNIIIGSANYPESEGLRLELHMNQQEGFKKEFEAANKKSAWIETEKNKASTPEAIAKKEAEYLAAKKEFETYKEEHQSRMKALMKEAIIRTLAYKKAFAAYYKKVKEEKALKPEAIARLDKIYEHLSRTSNLNLITAGSGMANILFVMGQHSSRFSPSHIQQLNSIYTEVIADVASIPSHATYAAFMDGMPPKP